MGFFTWTGKLLKKGGAFAVSANCCCKGYYCVLTKGGKYECRNQRPDPASGDQVLSEHKGDSDCKKACYERYYCTKDPNDSNATSTCVKEGDLKNGPNGPDVTGGPYPKSECESSCTTCPPCAEEACSTDRDGDAQPYNDCCAKHSEVWEYDGADWVLKAECAEGGMCNGTGDPPFPDNPNAGDTHSFDCAPSGKDPPKDNPDCKECKYNCSPKDPADPEGEKECKRAKDGKLTQQKCEDTCLGKWHCTATDKCERQQNPDPDSQGYDTEDECLAAAPEDCKKNFWYCVKSDECEERPAEEGEADGYDNEPDCLNEAPNDCPVDPKGACCVEWDSPDGPTKECKDDVTEEECAGVGADDPPQPLSTEFHAGKSCDDIECDGGATGACCLKRDGRKVGCNDGVTEKDCTRQGEQQRLDATWSKGESCADACPDQKQCFDADPWSGTGGGFWNGGIEGGACYASARWATSLSECQEGWEDRPAVLPFIAFGLDECIEILKKSGWCCCGSGAAARVPKEICDFWSSLPEQCGCNFQGEGTGLWGDPPADPRCGRGWC